MIPENLKKLRDAGVITAEFVELQRILAEDLGNEYAAAFDF
jgi:hypothetical protein